MPFMRTADIAQRLLPHILHWRCPSCGLKLHSKPPPTPLVWSTGSCGRPAWPRRSRSACRWRICRRCASRADRSRTAPRRWHRLPGHPAQQTARTSGRANVACLRASPAGLSGACCSHRGPQLRARTSHAELPGFHPRPAPHADQIVNLNYLPLCLLMLITDPVFRQLHKDVAAVVINIDWGDKSPGAGHAAAGRTGGWGVVKALCTFNRLRRCAFDPQSIEAESAPRSLLFGDGPCWVAFTEAPQ